MTVGMFTGEWGNVWSVMRQFMMWVLVVGYLTKIAMDSYKFAEIAGTASQIKIPVLNAEFLGIGGNWGAALTPLLLTAFLVAVGIFFAVLAGTVVGLGGYAIIAAGNPFDGASSAVAVGLAWLFHAFPMALMIALAIGYMVFRLTMTGATALFVLIVRSLPG